MEHQLASTSLPMNRILCLAGALIVLLTRAVGEPTPLAQDFSIVHHNPDSEYYVEGSGLVRLDDGTLISVVPVIPRGEWANERQVDHCTTYIGESRDAGKSWRQISTLPYYSSVPWTHRGLLYVFAMKGGVKLRNDDLLLLQSHDGGKTW